MGSPPALSSLSPRPHPGLWNKGTLASFSYCHLPILYQLPKRFPQSLVNVCPPPAMSTSEPSPALGALPGCQSKEIIQMQKPSRK